MSNGENPICEKCGKPMKFGKIGIIDNDKIIEQTHEQDWYCLCCLEKRH